MSDFHQPTPVVILPPQTAALPIVISVPHCGVEIPPDLARGMDPQLVQAVPDTDWFVHELYGFAPQMGITLIHARYSRYVIDLNRDPSGKPLYADQRLQSTLVPTHSFAGEPLYRGSPPDAAAISQRLAAYFTPYHDAVAALLGGLRQHFAHVLLLDAHSIRRRVPSVQAAPFPDLILGDQLGKTAAAPLSASALATLRRAGTFSVSHNVPFMGGFLTRHTGRPAEHVHALQLEMVQEIYMDEAAARRDLGKEARLQPLLRTMLQELATTLGTLAP